MEGQRIRKNGNAFAIKSYRGLSGFNAATKKNVEDLIGIIYNAQGLKQKILKI